jgi:hypothetical protein
MKSSVLSKYGEGGLFIVIIEKIGLLETFLLSDLRYEQ